MNPEAIAYPFLSLAIFFEAFMLVTFLSDPARKARLRKTTVEGPLPRVALIIPCYNEEESIDSTMRATLALDYPAGKLEVILVNDGSKDNTLAKMREYAGDSRVRIIDQANGGKHTALNAGIAATKADIVGCLDADTYPQPDALKRTLACFDRPNVAAAFAAISIHEPRGILQHLQSADYVMGIFYRHVLCSINAMYVTPGPFSLYRREVVEKVGGFVFGQQTEDMEMALRLHRAGYEIENAPGARVTTHAMPTASKLIRQRMRWTSGFLRNVLFDYRDLFAKKYGALGLLILPFGLVSPFMVIGLFVLNIYLLVASLVQMISVRTSVPLAWQLSAAAHPFTFDWFYMPVTGYALFGIATAIMGITMMSIGKRISRAPTKITRGLAGYLLLYGLIAPVWYTRTMYDVVTGKRRGWR